MRRARKDSTEIRGRQDRKQVSGHRARQESSQQTDLCEVRRKKLWVVTGDWEGTLSGKTQALAPDNAFLVHEVVDDFDAVP
jgi:hypothetical protein